MHKVATPVIPHVPCRGGGNNLYCCLARRHYAARAARAALAGLRSSRLMDSWVDRDLTDAVTDAAASGQAPQEVHQKIGATFAWAGSTRRLHLTPDRPTPADPVIA
eukprot:354050-Chlamydomonas_euryale.AAC.8